MALEARADGEKNAKRKGSGFQVSVLGGTFAMVPGTQLLVGLGGGAVFSC